MNKHEKIYCKAILKNNDISLQLYYNTMVTEIKGPRLYVLNYQNNEYIIDVFSTASNKIFKSILKRFGLTQLEIEIIETIRKYDVVDPMDLVLKSKENPDEIPKLSVDEYLKLEDPLQQNLYTLIPKQNALQHKLNFIAHLLKTYKHKVMQAVATKTNSSNTVMANNVDDIINLLKG